MTAAERIRRRIRRLEDLTAAERKKLDALLQAARDKIDAEIEALHSESQDPSMGQMDLGQESDSKGLRIAKAMTKGRKLPPPVAALYKAGLTPAKAAEICGIHRDRLKKAWQDGDQFRPARPEWKKALADHGVPETVWRSK